LKKHKELMRLMKKVKA